MDNLKCMICGMDIKSKSHDINKMALVKANSEEDFQCCPFCGADSMYLSNTDEPYIFNIKVKEEKLIVILDHAMKLEVFNGDFYKKVSTIAKDESVKRMLKELSNIEFMHANIHKTLGGFKELPLLRNMDYSKLKSDEAILAAAREREEHAIAYYNKYILQVKDDNIKEVFNALSAVESEHIILTKG